jgi:uncharacterized coiled-coil DUF342 family protein
MPRFRDLPKIHPPTVGNNPYQPIEELQREHLNLSPQELKGSLEDMNEKWDKVIQQIEEVKKIRDAIFIKCKEIIRIIDETKSYFLIIDEHEKNKNE